MTAQSANYPRTRYGSPEAVLPPVLVAGMEANTQVYGGQMIGLDSSGYVVDAAAAGALYVAGVARKQVNNLTTNAPYGAANAQSCEYLVGPFPFAASNDGGTISIASRFLDCYVVDNQTVSLSDNGGTRLRAGYILDYQNSQPVVMVGVANPMASDATVIRATIDIPLATIQAQTSATAFNVGSALPANARLFGAEVNVLTAVSGGSLSAVTVKLQGGSDAAGSIIASTSVFTGASAVISTPGSNPYQSRGGQQIKMTLTSTGDTLANATAGHLSVDLFYSIVN